MILTLITITVCAMSVLALTIQLSNPEVAAAARAEMKRVGISGCSAVALMMLASLVSLGLWTWYGINVHEWRFLVIAWVPFCTGWLSKLATKRRPVPGPARTASDRSAVSGR